MDIIKTKAYYLIIEYALTMTEDKTKELQYIEKKKPKLSFQNSIEKQKLIARLKNIKEASESIQGVSHEMLVYIALDFLLNIEKDTVTRNRFLHINTVKKLSEWEEKYPKELREHYNFFSFIVDKL